MIFLAFFYGIFFLIVGYVIKYFQDKKQTNLENEFYFKFKNFNLFSINTKKKIKKKPKLFLLKNQSILINPNISSALQEIFDYILAKYINGWYQGFSNNEDFVIEIKFFFHTLCSEVLVRLSQVDTSTLVSDKILPAIVNHLDICYKVLESYNGDMNSSSPMQDIILQKLKSHLHIVMINRAEELDYLRCIGKHVIPLLIPDCFTQTDNKICFYLLRECFIGTVLLPLMDTLATPDIINKLICLLMDSSSTIPIPALDNSIISVPILNRYQQAWLNRLKSQKCHPKGVECFLRDEKHLYNFLQFIKRIESVHPISFFLLMDSITIKLLNPELNKTDKDHILEDLRRLNELIKAADEYSDLNILPGLHYRVLQVINEGYESVPQLTTCEIWMENYNSICQHTEAVYLAQYFESEFYLSSIYPDRQSECFLDPRDKKEKNSKDKYSYTLKSSLSLEDDSVDGRLGETDNIDLSNSLDFNDDLWSRHVNLTNNLKELPDLSSTRVKIPSISQPYITKFKLDFYFTVHTFKIDSEELLFKVHRKYGEFYVLEQKLSEFHGNIGRNLPAKKPWDLKKLEFLDSCKFEFETYLMFLINRPFLKNSQLLFTFLTVQSEFNANTPIDVNLGRFVKSVPMKLAKEKGQFLDQFLVSFHISCDAETVQKTNDSTSIYSSHKVAYESITKSVIDNRMHMKMFWNNSGFINVSSEDLLKQACTFSSHYIFHFYDTVCHIYETITCCIKSFQVLLKGVYCLRTLLLKFVESFVASTIKSGIEKICHEKIAVEIIHLIRDSVLLTGYTRTNSEKTQRRDQAQQFVRNLFPGYIPRFLTMDARDLVITNLDRIFDCLQQPKLNKQLSYILLDIVIVELFPEIAEHM